MSDVLEEWAKCQGQWMYLQPIFDSADIAKQLPAETKKIQNSRFNMEAYHEFRFNITKCSQGLHTRRPFRKTVRSQQKS